MLEITTQKHLLKKTFNNKAHGIIEVVAKSDNITLYTWIKGDYDTLSGVTDDKIKNAMEVLFDEKCRKDTNSNGEGIYRPQD